MKKILILMFCMILLLGVIQAKSIGDVDEIDWDLEKLIIKADGVYDGDILVISKDKAEIWIENYDEKTKTYHIDSLKSEDTLATVELYYEIQPDEINYRSHTGKYQQVYTYNNWSWEELEIGGYVLIDVILEYGTGSNTFVDAISGATWMNDGITTTLVENTDFEVSGDQFTIININYAWSETNTTYTYASTSSSNTTTILRTTGIFIGLVFIIFLSIPLVKKFGPQE